LLDGSLGIELSGNIRTADQVHPDTAGFEWFLQFPPW
jgi:hypothetical protein